MMVEPQPIVVTGLFPELQLFLVGAGYRVLKSGRVSRVTCDRYIYTFVVVNSYTFTNIISAIAFYFAAVSVRIRGLFNNF